MAAPIYIPINPVKGSFFSPHPIQYVLFVGLFFFLSDGHSDWYQLFIVLYCVLFVVLICTSLIISDDMHLFTCLLAICMSSLQRYLFRSSACILIGFFVAVVIEL